MGMHTQSLTVGDWFELSDLDDPAFVQFTITGTGPVELSFEVGPPPSSAVGASVAAGATAVAIPAGKRPFVRLISGTAAVTWSQLDAVLCDIAKCAYSSTGDSGADEDFFSAANPFVGFDDATSRGGTNPYEFFGFLHTTAAGLPANADIHAAWLSLRLTQSFPTRTFRVYGVPSTTSVFSSLTSHDDLVGGDKTILYTEAVSAAGGILRFDITSIVSALVDLSGWTTSSPIQLWLEDRGSEVDGKDTRIEIAVQDRLSNVTVLLE